MKEYVDILTLVLMTALTVGVVGLIVALGIMIPKIIKQDF
jgi:ABC-type Fe3+-siderophore transport system permease subunit